MSNGLPCTIDQVKREWGHPTQTSLLLDICTYRAYPLTKNRITIGRAEDSDIKLTGLDISRNHAVITREKPRVLLEDLKSKWGTQVNGKHAVSAELKPNDLIQLGNTIFKFFQVPFSEKTFLPERATQKGDPWIKGYGFEWRKLLDKIDKACQTDFPVLIVGETGVGKELIAQSIFHNSREHAACFKICNISAINKNMIESCLFGHEKGAFTGALTSQPGLIKACHQGTLFLDEIGDLDLTIQSKLLRCIQFGEIQPVGGAVEKIRVRFIAATNRDLTATATFRRDLYERFGFEIFVPPLRERIEDIKVIMDHYIGTTREVTPDFFIPLCYYPWEGNIRTLEFVLKNALVSSRADENMGFEHLPDKIKRHFTDLQGSEKGVRVDNIGKVKLIKALQMARGNVSKVIEKLNISRKRIYQLFKDYSIQPEDYRKKG